MHFKITQIATLLCIFVIADSAPSKSHLDDFNKQSFLERRTRFNRDISFGFPTIGFEIRSSFPKLNVIDVVGKKKSDNYTSAQLEPKIEEIKTPNQIQFSKLIDERHNVVKENPNEIVNTDKYTTIPTTEYTTTSDTISTETEPTTIEDYQILERSEVSPGVLASLLGG